MRFVEASLIMPLTLLITSALIALMMGFYSDLGEQIEAHGEELKDVYKVSETVGIRVQDRIAYAAQN